MNVHFVLQSVIQLYSYKGRHEMKEQPPQVHTFKNRLLHCMTT